MTILGNTLIGLAIAGFAIVLICAPRYLRTGKLADLFWIPVGLVGYAIGLWLGMDEPEQDEHEEGGI